MLGVIAVLFILVTGTYILARISSYAEESKWEELRRMEERVRKKRIDKLYGRDDVEEG